MRASWIAWRTREATSPDLLLFEYNIAAKWLELLKEIAPQVTRVAVLREATNPGGIGQFVGIQSAASSYGVEVRPIDGGSAADEIERAVAIFAREPNGGLIVTATPMANIHRELIIALAAQYRLPAVYGFRFHVEQGGLWASTPRHYDRGASCSLDWDRQGRVMPA